MYRRATFTTAATASTTRRCLCLLMVCLCLATVSSQRLGKESFTETACFKETLMFTSNAHLGRLYLSAVQDATKSADKSCVNDCVVEMGKSSTDYINECFRLGGKVLEYDAIVTCNADDIDFVFSITEQNIPSCVANVCTMEQLNERLETEDFPIIAQTISTLLGDETTCTVTGDDRNHIETAGTAADGASPPSTLSACAEGIMVYGANMNLTTLANAAATDAVKANGTNCRNNCVVDIAVTSSRYVDECFRVGGKVLDFDALTTCTPKHGTPTVFYFTMKNVPLCVPMVCTRAELDDRLKHVILPSLLDVTKLLVDDATCTVQGDDQTHVQAPPGTTMESEATSESSVFAWIAGLAMVSLPASFIAYQYWFRSRRSYGAVSSNKALEDQSEYELPTLSPDHSVPL